ncbi:hypothetical protein [Methanobrevibacter sp.]|uniref:hypothetical protein n=1 Tax=Methanobrevibacter sp. TaxID=66852 RepID=UPI00386CE83E
MSVVSASDDCALVEETALSINQVDEQIAVADEECLEELSVSESEDIIVSSCSGGEIVEDYDSISVSGYGNNDQDSFGVYSSHEDCLCLESGIDLNTDSFKINNLNIERDLCEIDDSSCGYNKDNLLTLSVCDSIVNDESLTIAFDNNDLTAPLCYGNTSPEIIVDCLDSLESLTSSVDSIVEDTRLASIQDIVSAGLESEHVMIQASNNYPQNDLDLPLVNALGVSRDFDDDAFICKSTNASGKKASFAVGVVNKSNGGLDLESESNQEQLASSQMEQIGIDAVSKALRYFKSQGIDVSKDYSYLYVMTSAGYVELDGQSTDGVLKGILKALGPKFSKKHLISTDDLSKKDLVIYFIYTNTEHTDYNSYALEYDDSQLSVSKDAKRVGDDLAWDMGICHSAGHRTHEPPVVPQRHLEITNSSMNNTNVSKKNQSKDNSSVIKARMVSKDVNASKEFNEDPHRGSPLNILYTLIAIVMVTVIFGVGYRKR